MQIRKTAEGICLTGDDLPDLEQTLECGQCFRWKKQENGGYTGIVKGYFCRISQEKNRKKLLFHDVDEADFDALWRGYFDLDFDYGAVLQHFSSLHPVLAEAAEFAGGFRILRQDPWETLVSFIFSQNNNIPRIRGIIDRLCACFGEKVPGGYAFPGPETLSLLTEEDLAPLRCGFRAAYLCSASRLVASGKVNLEELASLPAEQAREQLMLIRGVGPKVAECALLYGFHRLECFPMDVWMKRVMAKLFPGKDSSFFGEYAGIAQQVLFHYGRMHPEILC